MGISILQRVVGIEADTSINCKMIDAQGRLLTMEEEQLYMPEIKIRRMVLSELFDFIYPHR